MSLLNLNMIRMMMLQALITMTLFNATATISNDVENCDFAVGDHVCYLDYDESESSADIWPHLEVTKVYKQSKLVRITGTYADGDQFTICVDSADIIHAEHSTLSQMVFPEQPVVAWQHYQAQQDDEQPYVQDKLMLQMLAPFTGRTQHTQRTKVKKWRHFRVKSEKGRLDARTKPAREPTSFESPRGNPELAELVRECVDPAHRAFKQRLKVQMKQIPREERFTKYRKKRNAVPKDDTDSTSE